MTTKSRQHLFGATVSASAGRAQQARKQSPNFLRAMRERVFLCANGDPAALEKATGLWPYPEEEVRR
jgi:hypothetical protein